MNIAVLGTGMVGRAHAGKLSNLGHKVVIGTHDPKEALARAEGFGLWIKDYARVRVDTFAKAVAHSEIVIGALNGQGALEVLKPLVENFNGKTFIDISNPLDFSNGRPPTLFISNDNSLGEQIQDLLVKTRVVKAFNTVNASVQVSPATVGDGDHHLFIAGDSDEAKAEVTKLAKDDYGWKNIIDLGDIKSARGMEMIMPIWLEIMSALNSPLFNFKIVQ